jgi:aspartate-semialdehyde dehydrogenase
VANPEHIASVEVQQRSSKGYIVTNANCSTTGLVVPLRAIQDAFGIDAIIVQTMQAISGAGLTGLPSMNIFDNVIPYISQEEPKLEVEPRKILGGFTELEGMSDLPDPPFCTAALTSLGLLRH